MSNAGIRIAGLTKSDPWWHRVLRERGVEVQQSEALPAEINVLVESVELGTHNAERNYRPYLHVSGELRGVRAEEGLLPYGVGLLDYPQGGGGPIDLYYEFSDAQLAVLVSKGYFSSDFRPPEQLTGIEWEVPAEIDVVALAPETEADVPVLFVDVKNAGSIVIDEDSSGYEIAAYFSDFSRDGRSPVAQTSLEDGVLRRGGEMESLFTEEQAFGDGLIAETVAPGEGRHVEEAEAETTDFEAQIQEAEARLAAEAEAARQELAAREGTPENVYQERVASSLAEPADDTPADVEGTEAADEQLDGLSEDGFIDFGFDDEETAGIDPVIASRIEARRHRREQERSSTFEDTRAELARRAAEIDHGDQDPEQGLGH